MTQQNPGASADDHERAMARREVVLRHAIPLPIIATRSNAATQTRWCDGGERSLLHDHWQLQGRDADKKLGHGLVTIRFDVIVDRAGASFLKRPHDDLTRWLLCIDDLSGSVARKPRDARDAAARATTFDWILRLRYSLGVARMSDLDRTHFLEFQERLRSGEILDLVSTRQRLAFLISEAEAGRYQLRTHASTRRNGRVDWERLAANLGVTVYALARSRWLRAEIWKRFQCWRQATAPR